MKKNLMELGRSMVEMLGVLAIIGVLSIVGIQGYKKAMNKHKANEAIDLGTKVYVEAVQKQMVTNSSGDNCRLYLREMSGIPNSIGRSLGWDPPSWNKDISILAFPCSNTMVGNDPLIFFAFMDQGVCTEIKNRTEEGDHDNTKYRRLVIDGKDVYVGCSRNSGPNGSLF